MVESRTEPFQPRTFRILTRVSGLDCADSLFKVQDFVKICGSSLGLELRVSSSLGVQGSEVLILSLRSNLHLKKGIGFGVLGVEMNYRIMSTISNSGISV